MIIVKVILLLAGLYLLAGFNLAVWMFRESKGEVGALELTAAALILPGEILVAVLAGLTIVVLVLIVHDKTLLMIESEA